MSSHSSVVITGLYMWGHSYEFEQQQNWDLIEEFAEKISGQPDIWYATNIEIINYLDALKQLRFAADLSFAENPTNVTIYLSYDGEHKVVESGKITKFLK